MCVCVCRISVWISEVCFMFFSIRLYQYEFVNKCVDFDSDFEVYFIFFGSVYKYTCVCAC